MSMWLELRSQLNRAAWYVQGTTPTAVGDNGYGRFVLGLVRSNARPTRVSFQGSGIFCRGYGYDQKAYPSSSGRLGQHDGVPCVQVNERTASRDL